MRTCPQVIRAFAVLVVFAWSACASDGAPATAGELCESIAQAQCDGLAACDLISGSLADCHRLRAFECCERTLNCDQEVEVDLELVEVCHAAIRSSCGGLAEPCPRVIESARLPIDPTELDAAVCDGIESTKLANGCAYDDFETFSCRVVFDEGFEGNWAARGVDFLDVCEDEINMYISCLSQSLEGCVSCDAIAVNQCRVRHCECDTEGTCLSTDPRCPMGRD